MVIVEEGGLYSYKRPAWENGITVTAVKDNDGDMAILFQAGCYPVKVRDLPADAILKGVADG